MAILVTGGAGFIGGHIVDALLARGESVVCIDDLNDYYDRSIKQRTVENHQKNPRYIFIHADIRSREVLDKIFSQHKFSGIIHLAARAGVRPSIEQPQLYYETNVLGTLHILELAKEHGIKNVIVASSSSVYGNSGKTVLHEDLPTDHPVSPYAASKKAVEVLCYTYHNLYKLHITCLRFFTVYGPRGRPDMAPLLFMEAIANDKPITVFGDGTTSRDYTFISDIVQGVIAAYNKSHPFAILNLGNSHPITLNEFIHTLEEVIGKRATRITKPLQQGDVEHTCADLTLSKKLVNYQPTTSLREGLQKTYDWYKEHK